MLAHPFRLILLLLLGGGVLAVLRLATADRGGVYDPAAER